MPPSLRARRGVGRSERRYPLGWLMRCPVPGLGVRPAGRRPRNAGGSVARGDQGEPRTEEPSNKLRMCAAIPLPVPQGCGAGFALPNGPATSSPASAKGTRMGLETRNILGRYSRTQRHPASPTRTTPSVLLRVSSSLRAVQGW